jgi:hypothetical protein
MMEALISGCRDPKVLAQMARGRVRSKVGALEEALDGAGRTGAQDLTAEIRVDMSVFVTAAHLVPWAKF